MPEPYLIAPDPAAPRLTRAVAGLDHDGRTVETRVVEERPLTIFLNAQEIVTVMTIGDFPEYLATGYLLNQGMLRRDDAISGIDHDDELETVVVRTARSTDYEAKLRKKTRTSGCAVGTVFGDVMEGLEGLTLPRRAGPHLRPLRARPRHQHHPEPLSRGRRHPRHRPLPGRAPARLHGGRRPPQRRGQDRRLDGARARRPPPTSSSTPPAGSPPRW